MRRIGGVALTVAIACLCATAGAAAKPAHPQLRAQSAPTAQASIIGGEPASIADFPSLAWVVIEEPFGLFGSCSGTVVAPRVVLTAGHCVAVEQAARVRAAKRFFVVTGDADVGDYAVRNISLVSRAVPFPKFDAFELGGDAAVLILSTPVTAPPIRLASTSDGNLAGPQTRFSVAGWGLAHYGSVRIPHHLLSGSMTILPTEACKRELAFLSPGQQFCAQDLPSHRITTCFGDSGGPAIVSGTDGLPVQVGIMSQVNANHCRPPFPNTFERVDYVAPWVDRWIALVEEKGAVPVAKGPLAHLPNLSFATTKNLLYLDVQNTFEANSNGMPRHTCKRRNHAKVACDISWHSLGGEFFFGSYSAEMAAEGETWIRRERYKVNSVSAACWFGGGNRRSCPVHTRSGQIEGDPFQFP